MLLNYLLKLSIRGCVRKSRLALVPFSGVGTVSASSFTGVTDINMSAKVTISGDLSITTSVNTSGITDNGTGDFTIAVDTIVLMLIMLPQSPLLMTMQDKQKRENNTVHAQATVLFK